MHSALDLFTIGIGPSSSHTVGPMRAAGRFVAALVKSNREAAIARLTCTTYGSLAATGRGHGTDRALVLGLLGHDPETVDIDQIESILAINGKLALPSGRTIAFDPRRDLEFKRLQPLPKHPNGVTFAALDAAGAPLLEETWYSLGGGFIVRDDEFGREPPPIAVPYPAASGDELLAHCQREGLSIAEVQLANEKSVRPEAETRARCDRIWAAMQACVARGCGREGACPAAWACRGGPWPRIAASARAPRLRWPIRSRRWIG